ncbi:MAG: DUF4089 domain-containing protein [Burkholderiales bacterium]|nr:DUF4089 domain-containing protein [Burkholderiales bacterium]MDE2277518.1 DUF4089 domain-containing protein [Burkholderiales bacterium]
MDHAAYIDAAAQTLGLKIAAEYRAGVALYFGLAAEMAELLQGLPLGAADESGSVFTPVCPEVGE